ncbi:hypothetical protein MENTO_v1c06050 [Mesoplasma entomophilum]|uniref:DUF5673 domain-containing protein n=1 Tax=Mesoplasma entomophilum TaxID=2149 RepID=A0A3S5Y085_9MOLU|nr:hypothetical protein [Mesoplasma entomophilum]ATQ35737.1 hypothetical protein CS528_03170 [Mesoplasma entomophilum]ATZ19706.1 hypothetical protein MENTO_v1c06050 [Mesoplasma entomophilum]
MSSKFLIMSIVLIGISLLLLLTLAFYYYQFRKLDTKSKKYGLVLPIITVSLISISEIMGIITAVIYKPDLLNSNTGAIITTVIGMICIAGSVISLFFFIPYYGVALTKDSINLIGEKIDNKNIVKIISDTRTPYIFVFYKQGKRVIKKVKFSTKMVDASFFDEKIIGIKVDSEDALAYHNKSIRNK